MGISPRPISSARTSESAEDFTPLQLLASPVPGDPFSITIAELPLSKFRLEDVGKPARYCGLGHGSHISAFGGRSSSGETVFCLRCCLDEQQVFIAAYGPDLRPIPVRNDHRLFLAKAIPAAESKVAVVLTKEEAGFKVKGTNPNGQLVYNYKSKDLKAGLGGSVGLGGGTTLTANSLLTIDKNHDFKSLNLDAQVANSRGKLLLKVTLPNDGKPKWVAEADVKLSKNVRLSAFADPSYKPDLSVPKLNEVLPAPYQPAPQPFDRLPGVPPKAAGWPRPQGRGQFGFGLTVSF